MSNTHTKIVVKNGKTNAQNTPSWANRHGLNPIANKAKKVNIAVAAKKPSRIKVNVTVYSKRASGTGSKYVFLSEDEPVKVIKYSK